MLTRSRCRAGVRWDPEVEPDRRNPQVVGHVGRQTGRIADRGVHLRRAALQGSSDE